MATAVQLELFVDEKGAVAGVRKFDTAVKTSVGSVAQLDATLNRLNANLDKIGQKAPQVKKIGDHALTSLDNVRLLRDDFGIHIPRAMEKAIASSKTLKTAIAGIGGGLIALGAIEIGAHVFTALIEGAQKLWHDHLSLTAAMKDYNAEVQKAAHDDFGNTRSIETTTLRINEATEAVKHFHEASESRAEKGPAITSRRLGDLVIPGAGTAWQMYHQRSEAHDLEGQSIDARRQADELRNKRLPEQQHQGELDAIELAHAGDARLRGEKKITAEKEKQHAIDMANMRFDANREGLYANYLRDSNVKLAHGSKEQIAREKQDADLANVVAPNAGEATYGTKAKIADAKADADLFNLRREQGQELAHLREQALEASLRGVALYKAQESFAIEELKFKDTDSVAARQAVHAKFHAEELRRLEDERRATDEIVEQTKIATLTGIARVQAEGQSRIDKTNADPNIGADEKQRRVAAYQDAMIEEVGQKQLDWSQRVDQVVMSSQEKQVTGFARIRAEADKAAEELQRQFDEAHSKMDLTKPGAQAALDTDMTRLGVGMSAIGGGADKQQADLARKNAEETEQIEAEARSKFLSAEKQKSAAIDNEYRQRLQKLAEQLNQGEILESDYNRRVRAAARERDAEMIEAATAAREKMATQFDELFRGLDHPLKMLEKLGDKVAGEAAASLVQRLQQRGGGGSGARQSSGVGLIDDVLGGFGIKRPGAKGGDRDAEKAGGRGSAAEKVFSVQQATIHVGSASIVGAGSGALSTGGGWRPTGITGAGSGFGSSPSFSGAASSFLKGADGSGTSGELISGGTSSGFGSSPSFSGAAPSSSKGADGSGTSGDVISGGAGGGASVPMPNFSGGSGGAPPPRGSLLGGVLNDTVQGMGLFKQGQSIFGSKGGANSGTNNGSGLAETTTPQLNGTLNADGSFTSAGKTDGGMLGGGGVGANAMGAAGGALGMYSAVEGTGGVGGALKGAMSGMQLGMALGGPLGAGIGLAAGAIVGAIGIGGREQARVYDLKQIRPKLTADQDAYAQGTMDYTSAYSDVQQMITSSWKATRAMGPAAGSYWGDTIKPELTKAMGEFSAEQRAGRSMYTAQGASYAVGTPFVPEDMTANIHRGESIFRADQNEVLTRSVGGLADLHSAYKASMQQGSSGAGGGDRTMNMNVHAIDPQGVARFFDQYKHIMRSALNDSSGENSGGGISAS